MDQRQDLLQFAMQWPGTRGLLGLYLAAITMLLRALLGFDSTRGELAISFAADGYFAADHTSVWVSNSSLR